MTWLITGILFGWFIGVLCAVRSQSRIEKKAVENGYVKLDEKIYIIERACINDLKTKPTEPGERENNNV